MNNFFLHKRFMRMALTEARKGLGSVAPNPVVGCVIVKAGRVIAKGYHQRFGGPHAEAIALKKAGSRAKGATAYVTLEPCSYFAKTPPCIDAIIKAGIKKVIAAMADPNPANNGKGFKRLRREGIRVISGVLKADAESLNKPFIDRMKKKRPYITVKLAQSLDGKIATRTGDSKWISSKGSRAIVQRLRSRHDAIMVGVNTVIRDDPRLDVRRSSLVARRSFKNPIKIIIDGKLRTPVNAKIFKSSSAKVIIATTKKASKIKEKILVNKGASILRISDKSGRVDLKKLMRELSAMGVTSILAEGGGELTASLFKNELVDRLILFIAPILIGGREAVTSFEGDGIKRIKDALKLKNTKIKRVGKDFLVEACLQE